MTTAELLRDLVDEQVTVTPGEGRKITGRLVEVTVDQAGDVDTLVIQPDRGEHAVVRWDSVARVRHDRKEAVA